MTTPTSPARKQGFRDFLEACLGLDMKQTPFDKENSNENPIRRLPAFESRVSEAMEFGFGFLAMSKKCTEIQELEIEGKTNTWKSKNQKREKEKEGRNPWFFFT